MLGRRLCALRRVGFVSPTCSFPSTLQPSRQMRTSEDKRGLAFKKLEEGVRERLQKDLLDIVGAENLSISESVCLQHGQDEGPHKGLPPDVVVWPRSSEEVSEICRVCTSLRVPIIPHGTGTGLEGGTTAVSGGVSVDLVKNMDQITALYKDDFCAVIQPGVTRESLNQALRSEGLWFPVDPGANASICGMCATGASGTNAVRYGTIKENVINLEVVLADGSIVHTAGKGSRPNKSSAGYNLTGLMIGSEGTLGLITSATVRIHALPESIAAAVVPFNSVKDAVAAVVSTLQCAIPMARIEFLDEVQIRACNLYSGLSYPETPHLFLEFHGSEVAVEAQAEIVREITSQHGGGEFTWASQPEDRTRLWTARHKAYYANLALRAGSKSVTTDVCVPISVLPEMIESTKQDIMENGLLGPIVGHVGDGNFHTMLLFDPENNEELKVCKEVAERMGRRAIALGGTCTGEHGIGLGKVGLLEEQFGPAGIAMMRSIKQSLDPLNIMNPGKIFN